MRAWEIITALHIVLLEGFFESEERVPYKYYPNIILVLNERWNIV